MNIREGPAILELIMMRHKNCKIKTGNAISYFMDLKLYTKNIPLFFIMLALITCLNTGCGSGGSTVTTTTEEVQDQPLLKNISESVIDSSKPSVFADSIGNVYVSWKEGGIITKKVSYLMSSNDSGKNFLRKKP